MALVYWGEVDAASDATMTTVTNTPSSSFRAALIALLEVVAAGVIADNPTIIAAAEAAVANALEPALQTTGGGRLSNTSGLTSDLNAIPASGWYRASASAVGVPPVASVQWNVFHMAVSATNATQITVQASGLVGETMWFRSKRASVWGAWQKVVTSAALDAQLAEGIETPFAGKTHSDPAVIAGSFDRVRRRWGQDSVGPDGRFPQWVVDDIAARSGGGPGPAPVVPKRAPLALTCAAGGTVVDTAPARTVRYPVRPPVPGAIFRRVHLANRNDRTGTLYPGEVSFTGIWWGQAARSLGELNGATVAAPEELRGAFTTPSTGAEWVSEDFNLAVDSTVDHILSVGYTTAGQTNHAGQGGGWVSTDPADAWKAAPSLTRVQQTPFDIWLEFEIPGGSTIFVPFGDSLAAATAATLPVFDSWGMVYGRLHEAWPVHFAHHGSTMNDWITGDDWRWIKYGDVDYDAVIFAPGSNDVSGGANLTTLQGRYETLFTKVAAQLSPRILTTTILPRNNWAPEIEAVRVAYNNWLWQRPMGAAGVIDFAKAIESEIGTVRSDYIAGDLTHLTTIGYAQLGLAIPGPLVRT